MSRSDLNNMSIENTVKWTSIPVDRNELLDMTRELMGEVRVSAARQLKLPEIDGSSELLSKLDEILSEIEAEFDHIAETIHTSDMVHNGVMSLCKSVQKVHKFFITLSGMSFLIFRKKSLKKELALLNNDLRHRSTQITAALSLELLKRDVKPSVPNPAPAKEDTDLESRFRKGEQFYYGINVDKNYTLAFEHFLYAANNHHVKSMSMVADIYSNGLGQKADDKIAFRWLLKAEEMGCIVGKYKLGLFLINEIKSQHNQSDINVMENDVEKLPAERTLLEETGETQSQFSPSERLSLQQGEKFLQAVDLITESAEKGHPPALATLGQLFELADNYQVALQWYEHAAERGSLRATNLIGMLYFRGLGVPRLFETAIEYFKQAAKGGDAVACNNVAKCLESGQGCERNVQKALDMYKLGADTGSSEAMYSYGYLMLKETLSRQIGVTQQRDDRLVVLGRVGYTEEYLVEFNARLKEGVEYLRRAVESGVADAAYQLARLYEQGVGVPYDPSSAYAHYLWAAESGHGKSAMCAANILYQTSISKNELSMSGSQYKKNMITVAQLYHQAAKTGIVMCMNAYALLLEDGTGTESGEPLVYEAAKWFLAAAEEGLLEAAGNLGFLLATHDNVLEFSTIHGHTVSTHDVRIWLESLMASPLIQPNQNFKESIEKLQTSENKMNSEAGSGAGRKEDVHDQTRGDSIRLPKDLHYSILFGPNASFVGAISSTTAQDPPSKHYLPGNAQRSREAYSSQNRHSERFDPSRNHTAVPKQLTSGFFEMSGEEKKSSDIDDKKLTINGNTSEIFSLNSTLGSRTDDVKSLGVERRSAALDDMGSEVEDRARRYSSPAPRPRKDRELVSVSPSFRSASRPSSGAQSKRNVEAYSSTSSSFNSNDNNSSRKLQNLDRLKSKKSDYSLGE